MSGRDVTDKTGVDQHLLAQVLEDAREAQERTGRAFSDTRQEMILRNGELFPRYTELTGGRHIVAYFASVEHPTAAMAPSDLAPITALFDQSKRIENLDLLIHSPGGSAQTAEKIVSACRRVCNGNFRVVVPNMAKSAATMVACCSDQVVMGYLSELGPIDPQIAIFVGGYPRFVSAQSFLDGQADALEAVADAQEAGRPVVGHLQLLSAPEMSAAWIAEMKREIKFGKDVVSKHLKKYMLPRLYPDLESRQLARKASSIATNLSQANKRFSHGRMIGAEEARDEIGLDVEILERENNCWKVLWEVYVRMEIFMQTFPVEPNDPGPAKLFADSRHIQLSG